MANGKRQKDKQYNGHRKNEKRTNNIMAKGKQQRDKQFVLLAFSFGHYNVCPFLIFPLAIILFVVLFFSFGYYIVCPFVVFLWPLSKG
jgi:hypothetical protein